MSSANWLSHFELGGKTRGDELFFSLFLGVISLLIQAFEKAGFVFDTDFKIALALIPAIILIVLIEEVIKERWQFLLGYWVISFFFFIVTLISSLELIFNFTFPLLVFLLIHTVNAQTGSDNAILVILFIVGVIAISSFIFSGWGQSSILNSATTTTAIVNTTSQYHNKHKFDKYKQ